MDPVVAAVPVLGEDEQTEVGGQMADDHGRHHRQGDAQVNVHGG